MVSSAGAAVEVGNACVGNDSQPDWTAVALTRTGSPIPLAMPAAGVNVFPTRIPVEVGDLLGLYGPVETCFCDKETATPGRGSAARRRSARPTPSPSKTDSGCR